MVKLRKYDIQYQSRTIIKAQALVDLLVETSRNEEEELWKIFVDGSSIGHGSGVGVLLISPRGEKIQLAIHLNFKSSNKETRYETLIISL